MTDDGKQKTEKVLPLFVAVSRRHHPANRMRFLFTMSILSESSDQADCPTHPLYRRSRFTPSHTTLAQTCDLQTDIFHRNAKPLSRSLSTSDLWSLTSARLARPGGARRDRTDDLMLAKHALSQLSYGPWP
jgi:hypothetical protein